MWDNLSYSTCRLFADGKLKVTNGLFMKGLINL